MSKATLTEEDQAVLERAKQLPRKKLHNEIANSIRKTPRTFLDVCTEIGRSYGDLVSLTAKRHIQIADLVAEAKRVHTREGAERIKRLPRITNGVRSGERDTNYEFIPNFLEACSVATGVGKSMISKYLKIAELTAFQRSLVAGTKAEGNFNALYNLARESDPEKMAKHVKPAAVHPLFARAQSDPKLSQLLAGLTNPKELLGGMAAELPVPASLVEEYPELRTYPRVGDLRSAVSDQKSKKRAVLEASIKGEKDLGEEAHQENAVFVRMGPQNSTQVEVHTGKRGDRKRATVRIGISSIRVPRTCLEEALGRTVDTGEDASGVSIDVKNNHQRPEVADATVRFVVTLVRG